MSEPVAQRLLNTPLPVDRVARRVTRKARPENLWQPMPKTGPLVPILSREIIATVPPPIAMQLEVLAKIARARRDRLVVVGYAKGQKKTGNGAKWVVRCDCGNYEIRTNILRWLGTDALDMCGECRKRAYKIKGEWSNRLPAYRATVTP